MRWVIDWGRESMGWLNFLSKVRWVIDWEIINRLIEKLILCGVYHVNLSLAGRLVYRKINNLKAWTKRRKSSFIHKSSIAGNNGSNQIPPRVVHTRQLQQIFCLQILCLLQKDFLLESKNKTYLHFGVCLSLFMFC